MLTKPSKGHRQFKRDSRRLCSLASPRFLRAPDVWPEAIVPSVGVEEVKIKCIAETAVWKPNAESDVLLTRMVSARKELLDGNEYMRRVPHIWYTLI